ncbi:prepilin peptidase [Pollutimonas harenae]|uniref:Prepilin peptidase n=1 Tax=Pollutimonas harenae TaxID=657015 RepID=A0A853GPU4_9BURK|nr:A24 family peptidase [Pollutimonas harenae]NYT84187.1 prepilin peptidase [Pollutimonas harenae]TEA73397.1 prepilin peptidase [Pollutimonas harenae]
MWLQGELQLWQAGAVLAMAALGAMLGVWCAQAALVYGRLLEADAHADAGSLLAALRIASRRKPGAALADASPRVPSVVKWLSASILAIVFGAALAHYGFTPRSCLLMIAATMLLLLAHIDTNTRLLPDALTLPLLWLGLGAAWLGWANISLYDAVAGVMVGYGALWLLLQGFRLLRGIEGMGYGDLKLVAALGAWLGWQALPWVLLAACLTGIVFAMVRHKTLFPSGAYPFGPFLAAAGAAVFMAAPGLHLYFY